jgi:hypothetical protein
MIGDRWGATDAELAAVRPCDALLAAGATQADRAISIAAPPATVFRWLCQLRAAPYSYDLLDNFGRHSPRTLTPGLDELAPGQRFMSIFRLYSFAPGEHVTLRSRTNAVTYAVAPEGAGSRLAVRIRFAGSRLLVAPLLLGDVVMMRKQLRTLKERAERC